MTGKQGFAAGLLLGILLASIWGVVTHTAATGDHYQMISANANNVFLLDTQTGRCWRQFVDEKAGPTNWEEASPPFARSKGVGAPEGPMRTD